MASYKLVYFNIRAKGEVIRLLFALAEQEYEDVRLPSADDPDDGEVKNAEKWRAFKLTTLWGCLPELYHGELRLCQTVAIGRYLATKFGFMGKSLEDVARIDMVVCCLDEWVDRVMRPIIVAVELKEDQELEERRDGVFDSVKKINSLLELNNDSTGWFVGNSVTLADVYAYCFIPFVDFFYPGMMDAFPKLQDLCKRFEKLPRVAEWIAKRPNTEV